MAGFSQYSQIVKPAEYVEPVSLDLLAKGTVYKEQMLEQNLEGINNLISYMDNIPSLQGIDTEKKNEILNNVKQQASQLSYSDLSNPAVANQLKGYITSVVKDPDMQGIMQRGTVAEKILKEQKEAFDKNQTYWNQGLDDLQKYQSQGKYIKDYKIKDNGGITPDMGSLIKKVKDILGEPPTVWEIDANGNTHSVKKYDEDKFIEVLKNIAGPQYMSYAKYNFDKKYENVDPTEDFKKAQEPTIALLANVKTNAQAILNNKNAMLSDKQEAEKAIKLADEKINYISNLANDSNLKSTLLNNLFEIEYNQGFYQATKAANAISIGKTEMTDATKLAKEFSYKLAEINAQGQKEINVYKQKKEYDLETSKIATSNLDPLSKKIYSRAISKGINIYNNDGSLVSIETIQNNPAYVSQKPFYIGTERKNGLDVVKAIKEGNTSFAAYMIFNNKNLWGGDKPSSEYKDFADKITYDKQTNKFIWNNINGKTKRLTPLEIINETDLKEYNIDETNETTGLTDAEFAALDAEAKAAAEK